MSKRIMTSAALAFVTCISLEACSVYQVARLKIDPGYYESEGHGLIRRLIVMPGSMKISYDTWRVSTVPNDNAKHQHFDLIGDSDTPQSGWYSITQEGTDCGKAFLGPYIEQGKIYKSILILQYQGAWEPFGGSVEPVGDLIDYHAEDQSAELRIAITAGREPRLYSQYTARERQVYDELQPVCSY